MQKAATKPRADDGIGGTYVYDKELGKVVKVSDRIPRVSSKKGRSTAKSSESPCGRSVCGGGGCAMPN